MVILKLLDHLSDNEELIIRSMIVSDKNNTIAISLKLYRWDLERLYEQGILCYRNIQENSILKNNKGYHPCQDYKMQDFVWEKVKSDAKWTTVSVNKEDDDCPF
jgi:hypothetical protein